MWGKQNILNNFPQIILQSVQILEKRIRFVDYSVDKHNEIIVLWSRHCVHLTDTPPSLPLLNYMQAAIYEHIYMKQRRVVVSKLNVHVCGHLGMKQTYVYF